MTTRSIFQKICPACMAALPIDTGECACGHCFDHDDNTAALSSEAIRVQAEELYESYLAARAEQAATSVMAAQAEFAGEPGSVGKSNRVAEAIREAEAARAALAAQSARVAEMKKALPPAPAPRPKLTAVTPKKKIAAVKPVATPSPVRTTVRVANNSDTDNAITTYMLSRRAAKKAAAKATASPARNRPAPTLVPAKPQAIPAPVQTRAPNPAFRQAQAARAEKILRQAETTVAVKAVIREEIAVAPKPRVAKTPPAEVATKPASPQPAPKPVTMKPKAREETAAAAAPLSALPPPAPVLTRSAPRLLGADKKECPNCTASVDTRLGRCRCGFEFPTSDHLMPSLAMSEEERAEFTRLFSAG